MKQGAFRVEISVPQTRRKSLQIGFSLDRMESFESRQLYLKGECKQKGKLSTAFGQKTQDIRAGAEVQTRRRLQDGAKATLVRGMSTLPLPPLGLMKDCNKQQRLSGQMGSPRTAQGKQDKLC